MAYSLSGSLSGLRDKLYWRPRRDTWHCYRKETKSEGAYFRTLCTFGLPINSHIVSKGPGGQKTARPPALLRCAVCDGLEMERRGWSESGSESKDWRDKEL